MKCESSQCGLRKRVKGGSSLRCLKGDGRARGRLDEAGMVGRGRDRKKRKFTHTNI